MGPRIAPVAEPTAEQRALLEKAPVRPDGTVRNLFLTLLHHPTLLQRFNAFAGTFMRFSAIGARDRELVVLRVAGRTGCPYELAQHIAIARDAGIADDEIRAVLLQDGAPGLAGDDARLMALTDALLADGAVDDALWAELAQRYDDAALLELLCLVGFYKMAADVMNVVGIPLEDHPELAIDWSRVTADPGRTPS